MHTTVTTGYMECVTQQPGFPCKRHGCSVCPAQFDTPPPPATTTTTTAGGMEQYSRLTTQPSAQECQAEHSHDTCSRAAAADTGRTRCCYRHPPRLPHNCRWHTADSELGHAYHPTGMGQTSPGEHNHNHTAVNATLAQIAFQMTSCRRRIAANAWVIAEMHDNPLSCEAPSNVADTGGRHPRCRGCCCSSAAWPCSCCCLWPIHATAAARSAPQSV